MNERLTEEISKVDHKLITVEAEFNKKFEALRMVDTAVNPMTMSTMVRLRGKNTSIL